MSRQQEIIDLLHDEIISSVGPELGNRVYDVGDGAKDNDTLPLAVYSIVTDKDGRLLGRGIMNNTFIQVSFFGKSPGVRTLRTISDNYVSYIDGRLLDNGMTVKVENKGTQIKSDVNDPNVQILTEVLIQ